MGAEGTCEIIYARFCTGAGGPTCEFIKVLHWRRCADLRFFAVNPDLP